jgi:hypothetical protein
MTHNKNNPQGWNHKLVGEEYRRRLIPAEKCDRSPKRKTVADADGDWARWKETTTTTQKRSRIR